MSYPLQSALKLISILGLLLPMVARGESFTTAEAAFSAGVKHLRNKDETAAREALEAALALAQDDAFRLKVYQPLTQVYRQLPEPDKMITAQEFIVRHSDRATERSLTARSLASFLYQRGLLNKHVERYEAALKADADDLVAVSMLAAAFGSIRRDEGRKDEFASRLKKLEQARSATQAAKFEAQATAEPQRAAWHWKEAAVAWRDAGEKDKALAAAAHAELPKTLPDGFGLVHFYHRHLGEVYADCGQPAKAIDHLEKAIAATPIKGYKEDCQKRLNQVKALLQP